MNPYGPTGDVFRSDVNQSANSFRDPMNISHLYPGWGMNPNYQTPSYDAPYRPAYTGPNPYSSYQRPGFFGAIGQLMPTYHDPYWGNPVDNQRGAFNSLGSRPMDTAAHIGQNYLVPTAAFAITSSTLFSGLRSMGTAAGGGLTSGLVNGLGLGGIDRFMGSTISKVTPFLSTETAAGLAGRGLLGSLGGVLGSVAAPFMAGMAVSHLADTAVFQPYIRARQTSQSIQDNFSGITFGSGFGGNVISGRGLSGSAAAGMATSIDRMGIRDMTFSSNQYHGIAAMGMRSGLFDDTNMGGITERVSSIASQIKMIMAISKDPNVQSAVEELSKLRLGGANVNGGAGSQAMSAYGMIGMHASAAGASVQRVMGTVGAQGQYMFQMNGITPYLGQISAANAYAGFASAQRLGIMSTSQFARMGGLEGATQSALAAQMSGINTPYSRMQQANQFMGSGPTSGLLGTVTGFGNLASKDPFGVMGAMTLYSGNMASQMAGSEGHMGLEKQATAYLRSIGRTPGPNGMFSPHEVAAALQGMGLPPEQIQAYAALRSSQTNSGVVDQNVAAYGAQRSEQLRQVLSQNQLYGGAINTGVLRPLRKMGQSFLEGAAEAFAYGPARAVGRISDAIEGTYDTFMHGDSIKNSANGLDMEAINKAYRGKERGLGHSDKYKVISQLNTAATSGGPGSEIARKLLSVGFSSPEAKELFSRFLQAQTDPDFKRMYEGLDSSGTLFDEAAKMAEVGKITSNSGTGNDSAALDGITGIKASISDNLRLIGQASDIFGGDSRLGLSLEDTLKEAKYSELAGALKGMTLGEKIKKIQDMSWGAVRGGYATSARVASQMKMTPEQVANDPSRFSNDPAVQKAIRDARGDKAKISAIMQQEIARRSGGSIKGVAVNAARDASRDEFRSLSSVLNSAADSISGAKNSSKSEVDWAAFSIAANQIDKGGKMILEGATMFRDAAVSRSFFSFGPRNQKPSGN